MVSPTVCESKYLSWTYPTILGIPKIIQIFSKILSIPFILELNKWRSTSKENVYIIIILQWSKFIEELFL